MNKLEKYNQQDSTTVSDKNVDAYLCESICDWCCACPCETIIEDSCLGACCIVEYICHCFEECPCLLCFCL